MEADGQELGGEVQIQRGSLHGAQDPGEPSAHIRSGADGAEAALGVNISPRTKTEIGLSKGGITPPPPKKKRTRKRRVGHQPTHLALCVSKGLSPKIKISVDQPLGQYFTKPENEKSICVKKQIPKHKSINLFLRVHKGHRNGFSVCKPQPPPSINQAKVACFTQVDLNPRLPTLSPSAPFYSTNGL